MTSVLCGKNRERGDQSVSYAEKTVRRGVFREGDGKQTGENTRLEHEALSVEHTVSRAEYGVT